MLGWTKALSERLTTSMVLLSSCAMLGTGGAAAAGNGLGFNSGDWSVYFGHNDVSNGFENRDFGGLFLNTYRDDGVGLHFELAGQSREETASFASLGVSWKPTSALRTTLSLGTSSDNEGIFPEVYARAALDYDFGAEQGLLAKSALTFRDYRNGSETVTLDGSLIRYFPADARGNFSVGQIDLSVTHADPGSTTGWEASAGLTRVLESGWSFGLNAGVGLISYDTELQAVVENDFYAVRPTVAYRMGGGMEIFARGEYLDSDFYTLTGILVGFKSEF